MPKITLTAEEEIQYLRELDIIQELMPGLEVQISIIHISEPTRQEAISDAGFY